MKLDARSATLGTLLLAVVFATVAWQTPVNVIKSTDRVLAKLTERDLLIALRGDNAIGGPGLVEDDDTSASATLIRIDNTINAGNPAWLSCQNHGDTAISFQLSTGPVVLTVAPGHSGGAAVSLVQGQSISWTGAGGEGQLRFAWAFKETNDF